MRDVILHIGLHKTATRFLQRAVFASLDEAKFAFNPAELIGPLKTALRNHGPQTRAAFLAAAESVQERIGDRNLVLSEPTISGDMYGGHYDFAEKLSIVQEAFPQARIIYFVRRQSDWLHSAYRQSLVKDRGIPIETFLNYHDGEFQRRVARRVYGARNVEALDLRFLELYRAYARSFGPERVYLFRQEDLRNSPDAVYKRLAEALGLTELPPLPERVSGNRAFSATAIDIFFPRSHRRYPRPEPEDATVRRSSGLRKLGKPWRKFRTAFIRHAFDRIIYRDRDLLARGGMREKIDAHYRQEHERLIEVAQRILDHGPGQEALRRAEPAADDAAAGSSWA